ncbi:MAG TPA: PLP-dependent aminotransferase family protein [Vicinamibacteria bacterium]|nr:PLP-dependent aminotransferase family protein [Vicinamibacteria bacterium]
MEALADDMATGLLKPGNRMPTHRDLAGRLGVTVGTVSRAYAEAARRGLVSGEVGRGTFVRARHPAPAPEPRASGLLDLSQNHPPPEGAEFRAALESGLLALARQSDLGPLLDYPSDGGNLPDREAGAAWIERTGLPAAPSRVLVCAGSQHGITTVLATLLRPGDLLLTEALTYPGLKAVAGLLHLRVQGLPMDEEGLRPDAFEDACRGGAARALYTIPTIQNPTASVMPEERRREIAAIARTHGVPVVEDDIHALLPEQRPRPIATFAPELSYYLMSTSKTLVPGLRIAFVLAPEGMVGRLAASLRASAWAAAPLMAALASSWIRDGTADTIVAERRREAAARQALLRERLAEAEYDAHPFGYYAWLRLPEPWRADGFGAEMRARGVLVSPPEAFVVGRAPVPHAVRLCLGAPRTREALGRGLGAVAEALHGAREAGAAMV